MSRRTALLVALVVTFWSLPLGVTADLPQHAPSCRTDVLTWINTASDADQQRRDLWCAAVGPPVVEAGPLSTDIPSTVTVASWNMAVGKGRLQELAQTLSAAHHDNKAIVILVQEAFRAGADVPAEAPAQSSPARIRPPDSTADIVTLARRLGYWVAYVPSMRNGIEPHTREDRGNAILSTVPLHDVAAIELPFGKQRRVAVAATVMVAGEDGPAPLRLYSMHLDTNGGRVTQARALLPMLDGPSRMVIAGGDLNARWGSGDDVFQVLSEAGPSVPCDGGRTFRWWPWRLDHVFATLTSSWEVTCAVESNFYGSDHRPLIMTLSGGADGQNRR